MPKLESVCCNERLCVAQLRLNTAKERKKYLKQQQQQISKLGSDVLSHLLTTSKDTTRLFSFHACLVIQLPPGLPSVQSPEHATDAGLLLSSTPLAPLQLSGHTRDTSKSTTLDQPHGPSFLLEKNGSVPRSGAQWWGGHRSKQRRPYRG